MIGSKKDTHLNENMYARLLAVIGERTTTITKYITQNESHLFMEDWGSNLISHELELRLKKEKALAQKVGMFRVKTIATASITFASLCTTLCSI